MACKNVINDIFTNTSKADLNVAFETIIFQNSCGTFILYSLIYSEHLIFISKI